MIKAYYKLSNTQILLKLKFGGTNFVFFFFSFHIHNKKNVIIKKCYNIAPE